MKAPHRSARAVSILGHPVSGLAPIVFLSLGWIVLALELLPALQTQFGHRVSALDLLDTSIYWPLPAKLLTLGAVAIGSLLFGVALFVVWVRSAGGFGPLSDRLLSRTELLAGFVLVAVGVLTVAMIARGDPVAGQVRRDIAAGWLWHESIRAGTYPLWTDLWHGGYPGAQQVPPLPHLLQALIGFLRFDPFTAAKQLVWFGRMAGAIGFALLCAHLHRDRRSGLLGGILYGLSPLFHAGWMEQGHLSVILSLAILPWGLFAAEFLSVGSGGSRTGAALAIAIGALAMSHAGLARYSLVLLGLLMLVRAIPNMATRGARAPSVPGVLIGIVGGAAVAAGFVVPMIRDAPLLNGGVQAHLMQISYHLPRPDSLREMFRWNPTGDGYFGFSIAFLALVGIARAILDRWEKGRGIGPVPLLLLVVLPWFLIPIPSVGRVLLFIGPAIAAAGIGRRPSAPRFTWIIRRGIYPIAMVIVLLDLAPINLATSYRVDHGAKRRDESVLRDRMPNGRFMQLPVGEAGRIRSAYDRYAATAPIPSVGGPNPLGAPRAFLHQAALIDTVARALDRNGFLEPDLVELLAFHNIRYLLLSDRDGPVHPPPSGSDLLTVDREVDGLRVERAAPVWILDPGIPPAPVLEGAIRLDRGGLSSWSRRVIAAELAWLDAAHPRPVREARAVVLPNRMEIELPDLGPVEVRLARNDYPTAEVRVDGMVRPHRSGPLGGISIVLEGGPHKVTIHERETPLRRGFRIGQWVLSGLLFLVSIGPRRR